MARDRRPVSVELMATLDEKFIANSIVFELATPTASFLVDGAEFRAADGALDRELVRRAIGLGIAELPAMRRRLRRAPLGLTTPAWVPADVDLAAHVRFHPVVLDDDDPALTPLLNGRGNGGMDPDGPLWDFLVIELRSGRLAVAGRIQHAVGDGIYGLRVLDAICAGLPRPPVAMPLRNAERGPRNGLEQLVVAGRQWTARQPGARAAWREYWRKPVRKRVRRWVGRLARPLRNREIERRGLRATLVPDWASGLAELPLALVRRRARELGGSINDLTVAAALVLADRFAEPRPGGTALLVPISQRAGGGGEERNHIRMARVAIPRGAGLDDAVAAVRAAVAAVVASEHAPRLPARDWRGYASYLPWQPRPRYFAGTRIDGAVLWPVLDLDDELALFGSSHTDRFTLSVVSRPGIDAGAVAAAFVELVGGAVPSGERIREATGAAPAAAREGAA